MKTKKSCWLLCSLSLLFAVTAAAQDPFEQRSGFATPAVNENGIDVAEPIIVTGSYIPTQTAAEIGPNPVQVLDRYTIEKSPERTTEQLLRSQPVANANGVPASGNAGAIGQGGASISLRGLDPGATLVLIDGHRIPSYPSGTKNGIESFFDLNTIPLAAIDSIQILKDGASTTYGADAIAGVVNIKLRHDYRDAEINVEYGNTTSTDSAELAASAVFGVGNDKTSFTGVLNYYRRDSIFARDRAYDRKTPVTRVSFNASPFNLEISRAAAEAAAGRPITEVDPSLDMFFAHAPFFTTGTAPASSYVFTADRVVTNPIFRDEMQVPDTERYGIYLNADHKVFGDQLVAYADLFSERADVTYALVPTPTGDFATTTGVAGVRPLAIPPHSPGVLVGGPGYAEAGLPPTAYNPFNPFDQIISGASRGRLFDFGPRNFDTRTDLLFTTVGIRGDRLFNGSWGYDAGLRYSHIEAAADLDGVVTSRFQRILNAADPIFDPTSPEFIGTTVPYNPFGDYRRRIANNRRFADFVRIESGEVDRGTQAVFDLNIYSTELWQLPGGPVGIAFGAQFVHETIDQMPDELFVSGAVLGLGGAVPIHGSGESYAGYAETTIPIFGVNFRPPGFHSLDFIAAARFEAFDNGDNVMVPKFGLRWQPIDDSLTLRATWGEGFRVPTLFERFAPVATGMDTVFDPRTGTFPEVSVKVIPNANLQPEDARNFNAGVVYSPKFLLGLTVTIDLFNIETTGWINPDRDPSNALALIESGKRLPGESTTRDSAGNLTQLTYAGYVNSGTQKVRGADFSVFYELPVTIGMFRSLTQATYLDSYQFSPVPGATEQELRSTPVGFRSDDAYLKWKATSQLEWRWRAFDAVFTTRYIDGFHEFDAKGNQHWVGQTWFFDLQTSYDFGTTSWRSWADRFNNGWPKWRYFFDGVKLTLGINNVLDRDPPRSVDNFPRFIYDPTGRFMYASVTKNF